MRRMLRVVNSGCIKEALMETEGRDVVPLSKLCDDLGVTPSVLRRIIADFPDILAIQADAAQPVDDGEREEPWLALLDDGAGAADAESRAAGFPGELVPLVRQIVALRNDGMSDQEVRRLIAAQKAGSPEERLEAKIDRLTRELELSEKRRAEDRDRLLTALMRTHQEVRQLRTELAVQAGRKARKKGVLGRLFGV